MEIIFTLRTTCVDPFMARCIDHCMQAGLPRPSKCKADVDIDVNVVVYVDRLSCIATHQVNIDRAAGGLRYAILSTGPCCQDEERTYEETPLP